MNSTSTKQPYLTVRDLIEMLQQKPQDAKVFVGDRAPAQIGANPTKDAPAVGLQVSNQPIGNVVTIIGL